MTKKAGAFVHWLRFPFFLCAQTGRGWGRSFEVVHAAKKRPFEWFRMANEIEGYAA